MIPSQFEVLSESYDVLVICSRVTHPYLYSSSSPPLNSENFPEEKGLCFLSEQECDC